MNRRANAALEFALLLVILFTLLSGVVDWGGYFHQRQTLQEAATDGARAGAADLDNPSGAAALQAQQTLNLLGCPGCSISVCEGSCSGSPFDSVEVTAQAAYTPIFGWARTPAFNRTSAIMAIERVTDPGGCNGGRQVDASSWGQPGSSLDPCLGWQ